MLGSPFEISWASLSSVESFEIIWKVLCNTSSTVIGVQLAHRTNRRTRCICASLLNSVLVQLTYIRKSYKRLKRTTALEKIRTHKLQFEGNTEYTVKWGNIKDLICFDSQTPRQWLQGCKTPMRPVLRLQESENRIDATAHQHGRPTLEQMTSFSLKPGNRFLWNRTFIATDPSQHTLTFFWRLPVYILRFWKKPESLSVLITCYFCQSRPRPSASWQLAEWPTIKDWTQGTTMNLIQFEEGKTHDHLRFIYILFKLGNVPLLLSRKREDTTTRSQREKYVAFC